MTGGDAGERPGRVFVVDDHPVFRLGLGALLRAERDLELCGEAEDARTALSKLRECQADIVTVDISLKGGSGLSLIKQLRVEFPDTPVLAVSMHDETLFAERAMRAGAVGYLSKDTEPTGLIAGIRRALRGELVVSGEMADRLLRRVIRGSGDGPGLSVTALSDRELEVFELIGRGLRTREVAERLHISVKTVETHQSNIKNKLGIESANELVRAAVSWLAELGED